MLRRRRTHRSSVVEQTRHCSDVHDWVLGLPWVVERPTDGTRPDVRLFAVDCEPLQRRQLWLVTGLELAHDGRVGIAVVMPGAAVPSSNTARMGSASRNAAAERSRARDASRRVHR